MDRPAASSRVFRFGSYFIDLAAREVKRDGEALRLPPLAFECVAYLIERRDRAVGRDELISAVWGRVDVGDAVLGKTIMRARRAFGDSGEDQNAIRTVPRFGYRWVAAVVEVPCATTDSPVVVPAEDLASPEMVIPATVQAEPRPASATAIPRLLRWLGISIAIAAIAWLALVAYGSLREPSAKAPPRMTVVLPVDVNAGAEWSWVRLGGMAFISDRLRAAGMAILPADTVVALSSGLTDSKGKEPFSDDVRNAAGASMQVEAAVSRDGAG